MFIDDIPKELKLGEIYDEQQILKFILDNDVYVISEDTAYFNDLGRNKYIVKQILRGYIHKSEPRWNYHIPSEQKPIYLVVKSN